MTGRRVLSLDGGGLRGVFIASFLASIEDDLPQPVGSYFDLIVGTSTGGIIAIGLGLGFSAKDILQFYEDLGPEVFRGHRFRKWVRHILAAKYDPQPLRKALEDKFGDRVLGQCARRLVIPSMNLDTSDVHVYKTAHDRRFMVDHRTSVVDVAMAAAAAPTYFPTHHSTAGLPLVDGGVWANNPVAVAAVEALAVLKWDPQEVKVLSVGCTRSPLNIRLGTRFALGRLYWAMKVVELVGAGQSSGALGAATLLLGRDNIVRVDPVVSPGRFALDSTREIRALRGLGVSEARRERHRLLAEFFAKEAEPFVQPVAAVAQA